MRNRDSKKVKLRHSADLNIEATVNAFTGRPLIVIDSEAEDIDLTPREARKLGQALLTMADRAIVKGVLARVGAKRDREKKVKNSY